VKHSQRDHDDLDADDPPRHGIAARLADMHSRRLRLTPSHWSTKKTVMACVGVVVGLAAAFAVVSLHYNDTVLGTKVCPSLAEVSTLIGADLGEVSGIQVQDLHSCHYSQGSDPKALWIDAVVPPESRNPSADDPCHNRRRFTVAGHRACSVAGSRATTPGRPSLYIETRHVDLQLTTDLASVSMARLERLGEALTQLKTPLFDS